MRRHVSSHSLATHHDKGRHRSHLTPEGGNSHHDIKACGEHAFIRRQSRFPSWNLASSALADAGKVPVAPRFKHMSPGSSCGFSRVRPFIWRQILPLTSSPIGARSVEFTFRCFFPCFDNSLRAFGLTISTPSTAQPHCINCNCYSITVGY